MSGHQITRGHRGMSPLCTGLTVKDLRGRPANMSPPPGFVIVQLFCIEQDFRSNIFLSRSKRRMRRDAFAREVHHDEGLRLYADEYELVPTRDRTGNICLERKPFSEGTHL